jgi:hypothetical protein
VKLAKPEALESGAWEDIRNPGPKVAPAGKIVTDPAIGEPLPDTTVPDASRNTILRCMRMRSDLLGLAVPRKSMSLQASLELDSENESLQAQLAEAYVAALREKDDELAGLRAQLARAPASGPPALIMTARGAE